MVVDTDGIGAVSEIYRNVIAGTFVQPDGQAGVGDRDLGAVTIGVENGITPVDGQAHVGMLPVPLAHGLGVGGGDVVFLHKVPERADVGSDASFCPLRGEPDPIHDLPTQVTANKVKGSCRAAL